MLATEILVTDIPDLSVKDSLAQALAWMDEFKVMHLPIVEEPRFFGMISEDYIMDQEDISEPIEKHLTNLIQTHVYENEHIFEVVKRVEEHKLSVIPILSVKNLYLGVISITNLMEVIAEMPVVKSPGGVIVMDININDYSMSELSRIIESNDAKILGCFITRNQDSQIIELTIKLNKINIQGILQAFERHGYSVTASYDQSDSGDDVMDRYNNLMNYLNI